MNDPVPYRIRDEDIDEVLKAYDAPAHVREDARRDVRQRMLEIDEVVRTAPETTSEQAAIHRDVLGPDYERPGEQAPDRRELALAAIEDLLITGGFVEPGPEDERIYPVLRGR